MKVEAIHTLKDNYVWVLVDELTHSAIVIDPGIAAPVIAYLRQKNQLTLAAILVTHHHWDHTNGIKELLSEFPAPVYGPANEEVAGMTNPLKEQQSFRIKNFPHDIAVIDIPGHTSGHIAYYVEGKLFCGDTLFAAGCGRLFEGTADQMTESLKKITSLPDETQIYCAHEYTLNNLRFAQLVEPHNSSINQRLERVKALRNNNEPSLPSTLKEEKETNPFLRCTSPEVKASVEQHAGETFDNSVAIFKALRKWKDTF